MWPTLIEQQTSVGPVGVHTYGLFILLAFCASFAYVHVKVSQVGINPDRLIPAYIAAAVGGLLGGRLLYAIAVVPKQTLEDPTTLFSFSGFAFYGGMLGGIAGVFVVATAMGIPRWKLGDVGFSATVLGLGVGRLGCFFAGCCHGAPAPVGADPMALLPEGALQGQLWLSNVWPFLTLEFHAGVGRIHDTHLFPTQLWSAFVGIGLWATMFALWHKRRFDGQWVALVLIVEPIFRFLIETFRADNRGYVLTWEVSGKMAEYLPGMAAAGAELGEQTAGTAIMGLTTSQGIGLCMVIVGFVIYGLRFNAGVEEEIPYEPEEDEDFE